MAKYFRSPIFCDEMRVSSDLDLKDGGGITQSRQMRAKK